MNKNLIAIKVQDKHLEWYVAMHLMMTHKCRIIRHKHDIVRIVNKYMPFKLPEEEAGIVKHDLIGLADRWEADGVLSKMYIHEDIVSDKCIVIGDIDKETMEIMVDAGYVPVQIKDHDKISVEDMENFINIHKDKDNKEILMEIESVLLLLQWDDQSNIR